MAWLLPAIPDSNDREALSMLKNHARSLGLGLALLALPAGLYVSGAIAAERAPGSWAPTASVVLPDKLAPDPAAFAVEIPSTGSATPWEPTIEVFEISDSLVAFFDGRDTSTDPKWLLKPGNWSAFDAGLGTIVFAVHDRGEALVLDSLWTRSQGEYIRKYLAEKHGVKRFTLVLSHWHLDHIGGNGAFADSTIVSSRRTAEVLGGYAEHIRAGTLWGPPAMPDFTMPNLTFNDRMDIQVGGITVKLSHFMVHSDDHIFVYLPDGKIGLVGDMTEDTVPVMSHPAQTPQHIAELRRLRLVDMDVLYPNHGNPKVISGGGHDKRVIDAAIEYQRNMLLRANDDDFLEQPLESFVPVALRDGVVSVHDYYRVAHEFSRRNVHKFWNGQQIPNLD
jgi:glyoxylase-like metal-dependent hydrolase (beta-lactamase superfamily II)